MEIKVSGTVSEDGKKIGDLPKVVVVWEAPTTIAEALERVELHGEAGILNLIARDFSSNLSNTVRDKGRNVFRESQDTASTLDAMTTCGEEYKTTGSVPRSRGAGKSISAKADDWITANRADHAEMFAEYGKLKFFGGNDGTGDPAAAVLLLVTYYKEHGPQPEKK